MTTAVTGEHAALSEFEETLEIDEAVVRDAEWREMRVGYETYLHDFDDAPLLVGEPSPTTGVRAPTGGTSSPAG